MASLYEAIGADPSASFVELRTAFKRKALEVHPDKGGTKEQFQQALAALEGLSNPAGRARYDQHLRVASSRYHSDERADQVSESAARATGLVVSGHKRPCKRRAPAKPTCSKHSAAKRHKSKQSACETQQDILSTLHTLLRGIPVEQRRTLIAKTLPDKLRRELETWMLARISRVPVHVDFSHASEASTSPSGNDEESLQDIASSDNDSSSGETLAARFLLNTSSEVSIVALCDGSAEHNLEDDADDARRLLSDGEQTSIGRDVTHESSSGRGRIHTRGLASTVKDGTTYYWGSQTLGTLRMTSRWTTDLSQAVDHLLILTTAKQKAMQFVMEGSRPFEERIRCALTEALAEANIDIADAGLRYTISLHKSYWIGRRSMICTPSVHNLQVALVAWRRFADLQEELSSGGQVTRNMLQKYTPIELEDNWRRFCEAFIDVCANEGHDRALVAARLHTLAEAHRPHREQQLERWNVLQMTREERWQRHFAAAMRRNEARETRQMAREDQRVRSLMRCANFEAKRAEKMVCVLVARWIKQQARKASELRRQYLHNLAEQRAAARLQRRKLRSHREARWREMNRRNITTADLLGHTT